MEEALFIILTDEQKRTPEAIEQNFDENMLAGLPWAWSLTNMQTDKAA